MYFESHRLPSPKSFVSGAGSPFGDGGRSVQGNWVHCGYLRPLPQERSPRALGASRRISWRRATPFRGEALSKGGAGSPQWQSSLSRTGYHLRNPSSRDLAGRLPSEAQLLRREDAGPSHVAMFPESPGRHRRRSWRHARWRPLRRRGSSAQINSDQCSYIRPVSEELLPQALGAKTGNRLNNRLFPVLHAAALRPLLESGGRARA